MLSRAASTCRWMLVAGVAFAATLARADTIAPPPSLAVEGVPPIPVETAREVQRYAQFTLHGMLSWHPQRREMLVRRRHGATGQVHLVEAPGATPKPLTDLDDPVAQAEYQPVKGDYFVFTRATAGDDLYRLYRFAPGETSATPLSPAGERVGAFAWSPRGDRLVYAAQHGSGDDARTMLTLVDPLHPQHARTLATFEHGRYEGFHFSRDARRIAFVERVSPAESHVWVIDTLTGSRGRVTPVVGKPVSYSSPQFSRDGRALFVLSDRDSEFRRLAFLPLGPGREKVLTAAHAHDVDAFEIAWDPNRIAFTTNEDGTDVLRFLDAASFAELPRPPLFDAVIDSLQWRPGSDELAFHVSSARTAGDIFSYQLRANRLVRWTNGNNPEVNTRDLAEPQLVKWKSFDGREVSGFLYAPPPRFTGPRPVMVILHGGPALQAKPGFIGRYNYLVSELGVALIYPNVRGSSGFGKSFAAADDGPRREDAVRDVGALLDWIGAHKELDASRVILAGASYGGYLSLAASAAYPDRVAGTTTEMGISNFVTFLEGTPAWRREQRRIEYGDERDASTRAWLESISPLARAEKLRRPVLVVQGDHDAKVPSAQSEELVAALRKQGTPVWRISAHDEGHGFVRKANAEYLFLATVEFVKAVLKP